MGDNYMEDVRDPEEADESLSLCDLPINREDIKYDRRSPSEPPEFFEFFCDLTSDLCPADDIFFCGKLVPFKDPSLTTTHNTTTTKEHKKHAVLRRRCESLPEFQSSRSNTIKTRLMRTSRSLDSRKLDRSSSSDQEIDRNLSGKSFGKSDTFVRKIPKSPWYLLMFGMVKFPPEMELRDIKNRQVRQNPASLIPALDAGRRKPVNRCVGKGSWGLLRALSCKDPACVAVTASLSCVPQV